MVASLLTLAFWLSFSRGATGQSWWHRVSDWIELSDRMETCYLASQALLSAALVSPDRHANATRILLTTLISLKSLAGSNHSQALSIAEGALDCEFTFFLR